MTTQPGSRPTVPRFVTADELRGISTADLLAPVAAALVEASRGTAQFRAMIFDPAGAEGDVHVKSAWSQSGRYFVVKVATWFATGRTAVTDGYFAVHDAHTGRLVAILDDRHHLTDVRTAAAAALSLPVLANPEPPCIGVLGTGRQAFLQALEALRYAPDARALVWGRRRAAAERLREQIGAVHPRTEIDVLESAEEVVAGADLVMVATASRTPIVRGAWLRPGQHIVSVGADDLTKHELDPECFARADLVVVDSNSAAPRAAGDLHQVIENGDLAAGDLVELGHLLSGDRAGRASADQITVVKLVGLGVQDLAAAEVAMQRLTAAPATQGAAS
jgi:ornithine cyclodeaminase/alanine dehydrogenase-like protein (mu-crystallin family)